MVATLIRMVNETRGRLTTKSSHLQPILDQDAGHPFRHRPADNSAAAEVKDRHQVGPFFRWGVAGNIRQPLLILLLNGRVALQQVWSYYMGLVGLVSGPVLLRLLGTNVVSPHLASCPVLPARLTQR